MRIGVFLGARYGSNPRHQAAVRATARSLHSNGIGLVYGGASIGLMGLLADNMLALDGEVIGVMPEGLIGQEGLRSDLTEVHVLDSMHERKALMAELSDAFLVLPGGIGTLDEFFEIWTWQQLKFHRKPIGLLNSEGYFDPLLSLARHMVDEGFVEFDDLDNLIVSRKPDNVVARIIDAHVRSDVYSTQKI